MLGPNGAGKTTTISCIAGLNTEWSGEMKLELEKFSPASNPRDRQRIGLVPQEIALYENLSAQENLSLFAELTGVPAAERTRQITKNLELAGLTERKKDLVRTFSGGMKRRLNLAVGLLHEPDLLLLDEPTVGVDPQSRNHLFETLQRLKSEGLSILYTTHYMEEAQKLCDRLAIMNEGKIVVTGSAKELAQSIEKPNANLEEVFLHFTGRSLRDE